MKTKIRISVFFLLCFVLIASVWGYGSGSLYGPVLFSDEFGYWAGAAWMIGKDWAQVTSVGYYYSFGYSFLLLPCLAAVPDPVTAYRLGTACNALFLCISLLALYRFMKKMCPETDDKKRAFFCFAAICCPGALFYMQMTLPEVLLIGLLLLTAFSLFRCLDKPGILNVVILAVCLVYMYFVHMRTMGFFVAACITLVADCCGDKRKRKLLLFFFMTIILLFLAGYMVKNALTNDAYRYASEAVLAVNDYSGQVEKIKGLLNAEGLERLLISVMGKLFYLGCASLGLFFQGMWFLWKKTKKYCFALSKHNVAAEEGVCFYLFAGILFQVGISAIFTVSCERIDYILYGRYNEIFLPIVIALGMTEFMVSHRVFRSWLVYAAVQGAAAFCLAVFIGSREITQVYGYFITGISYALDGSGFGGPRTIWAAYAVSCAVAMAAWLIIGFWEKKGNGKAYYAAAGMLAAVWIGTALWAASLYIYPHNMENREDIRLCEQLSWLNEEGRKLCFLNSPGVTYVDLLQYMLRDISIQVLDGENCMKELTSDMAVLIYRDNQEVAALSEVYNVRVETSHFILLYNS